ncbi:MAG: YceI family protein [Myxococcales bacterium]|nr:MAG: YceI family protein [Myxococcales bacterium]
MRRALYVACLLLGACSKPEEKPRRTEPWPAQPSASSSAGTVVAGPKRFRFSPDSKVRFSSSGKKGKVSGRFAISQGALELDPREPKNTHASLDVDLTTLTIETDVPPGLELGGAANVIGLQWLELGAEVPAERRESFKTARFELTSLEGPSPAELAARRRTGFTRVMAVGTLLLHGFRAPVHAELLIAGGGSERLSIRTARPFVVVLGTHDLTARSPSGIADARGAARAADWVGKSVSVELDLFAELEAPLK